MDLVFPNGVPLIVVATLLAPSWVQLQYLDRNDTELIYVKCLRLILKERGIKNMKLGEPEASKGVDTWGEVRTL